MKVFTATVLTSLALAAPALAAYTQHASTFSAGGGETSSTAYTNLGVIGQPAIVGSSAGSGYTANHGFLSVLGDGFKILYPVISATPGTLTFSLMAGNSGNQLLGISNTGGSNLNWTVTKGSDPGSIFSFTPLTGINSGTVTVTANAASLTPGTYSNTLTISGEGISQTTLVQLDLTVTPTLYYTLAVTLKQATPGKGGGNITMAILRQRQSKPAAILILPAVSIFRQAAPLPCPSFRTAIHSGAHGAHPDAVAIRTARLS